MEKVMSPWIPIEAKEDDGSVSVKIWGRENKSGNDSFFESMISHGEELLFVIHFFRKNRLD